MRWMAGKGEHIADGLGRSGTGSEVEFYVVFILVEPSSRKGLSCMRAPQRELVPVIDSAIRGWEDFYFASSSIPQQRS